MVDSSRITLIGSSIPQPDQNATKVPSDINQTIEINIILNPPTYLGMTLQQYTDSVILGNHPVLNHAEFESAFGAIDTDLDAISSFTSSYNITEKARYPSANYIKFQGTIGNFNNAFGITLEEVSTSTRTYRSYSGELSIPSNLSGMILHVMGLDSYMTVMHHAKRFEPITDNGIATVAAPLTPPEVAAAYQFPSGNAAGAHIGIVEIGGGYLQSDINSNFALFNVTPPTIVDISVNGGTNLGAGGSASIETQLDIVCCGGVANGATLYMYFGPDTGSISVALQNIYDVVNAAVIDIVHNPSVISVSYGFGQSYWDAVSNLVPSFEATFQAAIVKGISVCVASGDDGAQGRSNSAPSVGYPGASPYCICVGGTSLQLSGTSITSETVWNQGNAGTGGGIATQFALPSYQVGKNLTATPYGSSGAGSPTALTHRGAPDLSANSDPATGYELYNAGVNIGAVGGTSAAAPLIAGLLAIINANKSTRVGFINSVIYDNPSAFRDTTVGNNYCTGLNTIGWKATAGWDACTGWGSPIGTAISDLFSSLPTLPPIYPIYNVGSIPTVGQIYPRMNNYY